MSKIDNNEPVLNSDLQDASNNLYAEYKKLSAMKGATKRDFTVQQIEDAQKDLSDKIDLLENTKNQQAETGEFAHPNP